MLKSRFHAVLLSLSMSLVWPTACFSNDCASGSSLLDSQVLYNCIAGICIRFSPTASVACPTGTIAELMQCSIANYYRVFSDSGGTLEEAGVRVDNGGRTVQLRWLAKGGTYIAILTNAPPSSYPLYWVVSPLSQGKNRCTPVCVRAALYQSEWQDARAKRPFSHRQEITSERPLDWPEFRSQNSHAEYGDTAGYSHGAGGFDTFSTIYPGESATVSPEFPTAELACTAGFAYLTKHQPFEWWSAAAASFNNGVCLLRVGGTSIDMLPIHAFPERPSVPLMSEHVFGTDDNPAKRPGTLIDIFSASSISASSAATLCVERSQKEP